MLPIRYMKAAPTTYVLQFRNGRVRREGPGLSFYYYAPITTLVTITSESADVPFAFQETTGDFQAVAIQGQLTYRVSEPKKLASLLDFSVNPSGYTVPRITANLRSAWCTRCKRSCVARRRSSRFATHLRKADH